MRVKDDDPFTAHRVMLLFNPRGRDLVSQWREGSQEGQGLSERSDSVAYVTAMDTKELRPIQKGEHAVPPRMTVSVSNLKRPVSVDYRVYTIRRIATVLIDASPDEQQQKQQRHEQSNLGELEKAAITISRRIESGICTFSFGKDQAYRRKMAFVYDLLVKTNAAPIRRGTDPFRIALTDEREQIRQYGLGASEYTRASAHTFQRTVQNTQAAFQGMTVSQVVKGRCVACEGSTLLVVRMQTRGADEGATPFYFCASCGVQQAVKD